MRLLLLGVDQYMVNSLVEGLLTDGRIIIIHFSVLFPVCCSVLPYTLIRINNTTRGQLSVQKKLWAVCLDYLSCAHFPVCMASMAGIAFAVFAGGAALGLTLFCSVLLCFVLLCSALLPSAPLCRPCWCCWCCSTTLLWLCRPCCFQMIALVWPGSMTP